MASLSCVKQPILLIGWSVAEAVKEENAQCVTLYRPLVKELQLPATVDRTLLSSVVCEAPPTIDCLLPSEPLTSKHRGFKPQEPHKVSDSSTTDSSLGGYQQVQQLQVKPLCSIEDLYQDLSDGDKKDFDSVWSVRKQELQQCAEQRAMVSFRQNVKERKKLEQVIDESLKPYIELYEMAQLVKLHFEAEKTEWLCKASQKYMEPQRSEQESQGFGPLFLLEEQLCSECHRRKRQRDFWDCDEDLSERGAHRQRPDVVPFHNGLEDFQYEATDKEEGEQGATDHKGVMPTTEERGSAKKVCVRKFITPYKGSAAVSTSAKAAVIEM